MSKLSALTGKPMDFKIGELDLTIKPLRLDDLHLFNIDANAPVDKQMEQIKKLVAKVLKDAVPDATDEEINGMSVEHLTDLMNAIMKVNNLEGISNVPKGIKKQIIQR